MSYQEVNLKKVSARLGELCEELGEEEYHCRNLRKLLFCAANHNVTNDPDLDSFCNDHLHSDRHWSLRYHTNNLLERSVKESVLVAEMKNMVESHDEIQKWGWTPKPFMPERTKPERANRWKEWW